MKSFAIASGFLALLVLAIAGPAYRLDLLNLGQAFSLLRWAVYLGLTSLVIIGGYGLWRRPSGRSAVILAGSALAGMLAVAIPLLQLYAARSVPPIHDISTDTDNPPPFIEALPREGATNPPDYPGEDVAAQQRQAYPYLQPLSLDAPLEQVYREARSAAAEMGWETIAADINEQNARIEATDTTFWFGFTDDIVVRLQSTEEGTRVDVRSKSRVGKSDVGKNAERIRAFLHTLDASDSR